MKKNILPLSILTLIIAILITGVYFLTKTGQDISDDYKLKAPKDKVISYYKVEDIRINEAGERENSGDKIKYVYVTDKEVPAENGEDIKKRTENAQFFKKRVNPDGSSQWQAKIYPGKPFYKEEDKWYQTETAITSVDAFNQQMSLSWWERLLGKEAFADTYYSGVGDGWVVEVNANWDTAHDNTTGDTANHTNASWNEPSTRFDSPNYTISRLFVPINTSTLPDDAIITAADLYLYRDSAIDDTHDAHSYTAVVETFQASTDSLVVGDYEDCGSDNGIEGRAKEANIEQGSAQVDNDTIVAGGNKYYTWALNAAGLGWINKTGVTKIGLREGHDIEDVAPIDRHLMSFRLSEYSETASDPYLEVTYTVPVIKFKGGINLKGGIIIK